MIVKNQYDGKIDLLKLIFRFHLDVDGLWKVKPKY